jgi:hypothetical protein
VDLTGRIMFHENKRIIFHIGPPKSGSSAIQKWLNDNNDELIRNGIYYPVHDVDANGVSSGNFAVLLDYDCKGNKKLNLSKKNKLLKAFSSSGCHTLLLSSEVFFLMTRSLAAEFEHAVFLAYIRSPHEYVESIYNQSVKRNGNPNTIALRENISFDYLDKLKLSINDIGQDRFILRAYASQATFYDNLVTDMCEFLGFKVSAIQEQVNSSYCFDSLEFKRWLNHFFGKHIDHLIDSILQSYPFGINRYCLIPEGLFETYKKKSVDYLHTFFSEVKVTNFEALICSVTESQRERYLHQALNKERFLKLAAYLRVNHTEAYYLILFNLHDEMIRNNISTDKYFGWYLHPFTTKMLSKPYKIVLRNDVTLMEKNLFLRIAKNHSF